MWLCNVANYSHKYQFHIPDFSANVWNIRQKEGIKTKEKKYENKQNHSLDKMTAVPRPIVYRILSGVLKT